MLEMDIEKEFEVKNTRFPIIIKDCGDGDIEYDTYYKRRIVSNKNGEEIPQELGLLWFVLLQHTPTAVVECPTYGSLDGNVSFNIDIKPYAGKIDLERLTYSHD